MHWLCGAGYWAGCSPVPLTTGYYVMHSSGAHNRGKPARIILKINEVSYGEMRIDASLVFEEWIRKACICATGISGGVKLSAITRQRYFTGCQIKRIYASLVHKGLRYH